MNVNFPLLAHLFFVLKLDSWEEPYRAVHSLGLLHSMLETERRGCEGQVPLREKQQGIPATCRL